MESTSQLQKSKPFELDLQFHDSSLHEFQERHELTITN